MIAVLGTNVISPLGRTSQENYNSVKRGFCGLKSFDRWKDIPEKITVSVFDQEQDDASGCGRFESLAVSSIAGALEETGIDPSSPGTLLVLSTTKGDIDALREGTGSGYEGPVAVAGRIAGHFSMTTEPIIVCNACISGSSAQLLAARLLEAGVYDNVIVCGADIVSSFTVSGFLSLKALSPFACRPFDIERLGLNLGEAAATMVMGRVADNRTGRWILEAGAQTSDAYHSCAPSPDGDGVFRALSAVMEGISPKDLDCISLHGTATMFNDQMESRAVQKAGLCDVPAMALKGYFGHTLGAAGIIETIITMQALEDGVVLPAKGFEELGVSGKVSVRNSLRKSDGNGRFIKVLSGFGGCNCALRYSRLEDAAAIRVDPGRVKELHRVRLDGRDNLAGIYRDRLKDYPKFYKMGDFSKLAYVASELLLEKDGAPRPDAIILFNRTSSTADDCRYLASFSGPDGFFPSPSAFIYTLPNLAAGEIAIRNAIKGETDLYILQGRNESLMDTIVTATLPKGATALTGWVDYRSDSDYEADLKLITIE